MNEFENISPDLDPASPSESLRDRLRAEREGILQTSDHVDLVVSNWPTIALRYRAIPTSEFEQLAKQMKRGRNESNMLAVYRMLERCFVAVLVREDEDEEFSILVDDNGSQFGLSEDLAEYLGFDGKKPAEVLRGIFMADKYTLAPASHGEALLKWMQGNGAQIDEELLGE
jgi:hypothetical protein